MKNFSRISASMLVFAALSGTALAANLAWPTTGVVEIGSSARALFSTLEPSGLVWHSGRNQLMLVGDEGQVIAMNADGTNATLWTVSGTDLEDITVVDPNSSYVYLADENGQIIKYNLATSSITQKWSVTEWMPEITCKSGSSTCGMEALTYADGYFYAGYQYNGKIYKLDLSGVTASKVGEFAGLSASTWDISGLTYKDNYLYALYSGTLAVMDLQGNVKVTYSVPGSDQEGVAIAPDSNGDGDANIFIGEDSTQKVYSYDNFLIYGWVAPTPVPEPTPVPVDPDSDGDGVLASVDCNDSDATVSVMTTFYTDADLDGMGSDTTASLCAVTAPSGYSSNSNDANDSIPNAGVEISNDKFDNDGDGKIDEFNTVDLNGYHPYYSTLDPNASSNGKIIGYWALKNGEVGIRYADWSIYRYKVFGVKINAYTKITAISGTAYFTVSLNGSSVVINGYTGLLR
jgi:hypothetical protein